MKQNSNVTHLNVEKSIDEQAIHWFTLMNDEGLAHQNQEAFTKWYTQSVLHRNAFKAIAKMWDKTGFTDDIIAYETEQNSALASDKPRQLEHTKLFRKVGVLVAFAATLVITVITLLNKQDQSFSQPSQVFAYSTITAEIKRITLPDGSKLTLGPTSSVSYTELDKTRYIELSQGRAFFDVVSIFNKPFIVSSGVNTVEVTGTAFEVDVNNFKKTTRVSVVEGSVKVSGKDADKESVFLSHGQRISAPLTGGPMTAITTFTDKEALAWMDNKLIFNNTPITEFMYRIQPYVEQTISLKGFSSDAVTINTIVTPSNVHTLLDSLPAAYPLEMVRASSTITFTYSEN
ncbi:FecR family protein [Alteromonas mediterranea]|uniref:FecR family protein n=1 Tax=Alteromonas mediterranea TaxID=314275 RepID=UPI0012FAB95A|nr:FecR domain-containing protein [Alteromonas mediterranea]QGX62991.1 DUF4880 domain-containing protein [Alteromonas mediterranea]